MDRANSPVSPAWKAKRGHAVDLHGSGGSRPATHVARSEAAQTTISESRVTFLVEQVLEVLSSAGLFRVAYKAELPRGVLVGVAHAEVEHGVVEGAPNEPLDGEVVDPLGSARRVVSDACEHGVRDPLTSWSRSIA